METEVHGLNMLKRIGEAAFVAHDAAAVLYKGKAQEIIKDGESYSLKLPIPFVQKDQLQLSQKGDELTIRAGQYKRPVRLPLISYLLHLRSTLLHKSRIQGI